MTRRSRPRRSRALLVLLAALAGVLVGGPVTGASSAPPDGLGADHVVLEGGSSIITYDTSSITGDPILGYHGPLGSWSFRGDQLRTDDVPFGRLVTVDLGVLDGRGPTTLTVVVPRVVGRDPGASFATIAIVAYAAAPGAGAIDAYEVVPLTGTAQMVVY